MNLGKLRQIQKDKLDDSKWTVDELLVGLRTVKKAGDKANPSKKEGLFSLWNELKVRLPVVETPEPEAIILEPLPDQPTVTETVVVSTGGLVAREGANDRNRTVI